MEHHEDHPPVQLVEELGVLHQPFGHQCVGELDPEGGEAPGNAVQRQSIGELAHAEVCQQARRGHALWDRRQHRHLRSHHCPVAVATGILQALRLVHLESSRDVVQLLGGLMSAGIHPLPAAEACLLLFRHVDLLDEARQDLQRPHRVAVLGRPRG